MKKYGAVAIVGLLLFGGILHAQSKPAKSAPPKMTEDQVLAHAWAIHQQVISLDSHVDIGAGARYATPEMDPGQWQANRKCDLVKMRAGGLKGVFLAAFVGQGRTPDHGLNPAEYKRVYDAAIAELDAVHRLAEKLHPEMCELATSPADVERIAKTGKRVVLTGLENGYPIGDDLANVRKFYDLGVRYITLCHSGHNQLADSSTDTTPPLHNGLSPFGKQVVAEMNRLGIMVDVSHIGPKSFWDVIAASKAPIIASHSGCKAIAKSDRNLDDEQLKALTKNGGVIQVVALASYLKDEAPERAAAIAKLREEFPMAGRGGRGGMPPGAMPPGRAGAGQAQQGQRGQAPALTAEQQAERDRQRAAYQERMKEIDAKYPPQPATIKDFVDHIDHAVKVAGIDHVGVGTDFDGGGGVPGFNDHSDAYNVTVELVRRGYSDEAIRKIWGGNLLRAWRQVELVAKGGKTPTSDRGR
ncbi:MAG: dipeptidase [Bacteroidales bacterium]